MSSNFDFLNTHFPVLANFGRLAEAYCYSDSNSALMKLGMIGETVVNLMYTYDGIQPPMDNNAANRIDVLREEGYLSYDLVSILHNLRKNRNKAVHENYASVVKVKTLLPMAYSLCEWFMQTYGDWGYSNKPYALPVEALVPVVANKAAEAKVEAELAKAAEETAIKAEKIPTPERKKQAAKAANQRPKTEAETRMLIDEQLRQVGWEADTEVLRYSNGTRPTKGRNIAIAEWPTYSSVGKSGRADYALFVGLKLVAIIEAKAEHVDIPSVIDYQAKEYSRNIRDEDAQYVMGAWGKYKVPFAFATNGRPFMEQFKTKSGIWFIDLRKPSNIPDAKHGWMSPIGIMELYERNVEAGNQALQSMSYELLRDKDGLNLREYQVKAIEAAENAIVAGRTEVLLAMATGTGKTRTVLGMIYRFLKTGRFKRILFLVDRTSLGEQAHDVFKDVKLEDLLPLADIYNIKGLDEKTIDKETRIQVATVQGMVKRVLLAEEDTKPAVTDYDLIIIDEAHRGYTLDKEMTEEESWYHNQLDYQSKYRAVIEYFDAVKIALTATPALHTTQIFGEPVYKYTYREAVIEGYLVDHDAPHRLETKLSTEGIHYKHGDQIMLYDPVTGELLNADVLEDELDFNVEHFNKQIVNRSFNEVVLAEIARNIDPENPEETGKTLIYAVDDQHADMIVEILREIYKDSEVDGEAIKKITGSVGGGNPKKVQEAIKHFKNENYPSIVVTVDLLTTGIDVPEITTLVFMRRIKSRILFEQMLGRATRLCPKIHKTHFEIYDPVGVYESLQDVSTMKPVVANPHQNFTELIDILDDIEDEKHLENQINQIVAKLQRKKRNMTDTAMEHFISMTGGKDPTQYIAELEKLTPAEAREQLKKDRAVFEMLQNTHGRRKPIVIDGNPDELTGHTRGYGTKNQAPEDYLDAFSQYIQTNKNEIAALNIVCTRPRDLTRESLKNLRLTLDREGFSAKQLNSAITQLTNEEIAADIISLIRRYAIGSALISHEARIRRAVDKLKKAHQFTKQELSWIGRMEKYLMVESVLNVGVFDEDSRFKDNGGFEKINKIFHNKLESIVLELNEYLYDDGGRTA